MPIADILSRMAAESSRHTARAYTASAMSPIVWLCGVALPPLLVGAYCLRDTPIACGALIVAAVSLVLVGGGMFVYFAVRDPDRLQSEQFRLDSEVLRVVEEKGGKVQFHTMDLAHFANPTRRLPAEPEEGDTGG